MRIGMIADWVEADIKFAADTKIPYVEFIPWCPMSEFTGKRKEVETLLDKYNVKTSAMGFFNHDIIHPDATKRASELKDVNEMIDLCKAWHTPVFMIGAGELQKGRNEQEALRESIEALKRIVNYAGERGITVAVYNCHCWNYCVTPRHWGALLSAIPQIRFKYDCSHSYYDGRDYLSEIRDFGQYFAHFHVKGCVKAEGRRLDDPPAGLDQIDWRSVMALLYKCEYKGVLSLEPHSPLWTDAKRMKYQGLRFSANFIRTLQVD
ncbi:MAG TPA: sugar phosphate isomerase/epimerase [Planctomycetota bacterium]|nr:sugar phosphate isomerase/epimerase [Planctomycetota bacterium]